MRPIKFRAWDKELKKIIYFGKWRVLMAMVDHNDIGREEGLLFEGESFNGGIDNFILMQFTGLKDKNGKEIYGGDIVKGEVVVGYGPDGDDIDGEPSPSPAQIFKEKSGEVVWCSTRLSYRVKENRRTVFLEDLYTFEDIEVIGNIYENPKLKGGE